MMIVDLKMRDESEQDLHSRYASASITKLAGNDAWRLMSDVLNKWSLAGVMKFCIHSKPGAPVANRSRARSLGEMLSREIYGMTKN